MIAANKTRTLSKLFALLISAILVYFSVKLFDAVDGLQNSLETINSLSNQQDPNTSIFNDVQISTQDFELLFWDAEVGYTLAEINAYKAAVLENKGLQQIAMTQAQLHLNKVARFAPLHIDAKILTLSILIDQGAPIDFLLPKIDEIINLIPKDQDLKAELAKLCFKLAVIHQDKHSQLQLINRLNKLFIYSMDYRGMGQVQRYARLFNQDELLSLIKTNVQN